MKLPSISFHCVSLIRTSPRCVTETKTIKSTWQVHLVRISMLSPSRLNVNILTCGAICCAALQALSLLPSQQRTFFIRPLEDSHYLNGDFGSTWSPILEWADIIKSINKQEDFLKILLTYFLVQRSRKRRGKIPIIRLGTSFYISRDQSKPSSDHKSHLFQVAFIRRQGREKFHLLLLSHVWFFIEPSVGQNDSLN